MGNRLKKRAKVLTIKAEDAQGRSAQSGDPAPQAVARSIERAKRFRGSPSSSRWWLLFVGVVAALLCLPFIRTVAIGDEGLLLTGAERMLRGNRLYADFFEFYSPGGFVLTEAWFSIAGISFGSARSLAILTIVGIACFTYLACWQASKNAPLSALLATGWVMMSQGIWTQVSHHWFTTLFSMVAVWAALVSVQHVQRQLRWPLIAGAAAGMAAMVTPHRGALVMLAAMLAFFNLRRHRAVLIVYLLGCGLAPAGLLAYVIWHHALAAAFDDVILFTVTRYARIQSVPFGWGGGNPLLRYLFPLAALLTILVCVRDWRTCLRDRLLRLCTAFALAGFVGCFPRPDITHIAFAAPLACPLLACCMTRLTQWWRAIWWRYRYLVATIAGVVIGLGIFSVLYFLQISEEALRAEIVRTPRGVMAFLGQQSGLPKLLARIAETPSSDAYFFYPYLSILPFVTSREQVSKYDLFMPEFTLPSQYQDACLSVMQHASWVVIDRRLTDPKVLKQLFPAIRDADPREKKRFEQALDRGFDLVAQEGTFELRRRREGISDAVCAGIAE
jgi:hypothetical protein